MNFRPTLEILGILLTALSAIMLLPMATDIVTDGRDWDAFALSGLLTSFTGVSLWLTNRGHKEHLSTKQAFILASAIWIIIPAFAALPFMFKTAPLSYTNAFFEAMSGFSSSGSTVITSLDTVPASILLWRALLNWVGGISIIIVAIALLPMLRIGGMQLFKMETLDKSDKLLPRTAQFTITVSSLYFIFTTICAISLWLAGMGIFDAICHALTVIANGGFSTHDTSIAFFNNVTIEVILIITMIMGCFPVILYIQAGQGHYKPLWRDTQLRWFLSILCVSILSVALWLIVKNGMTIAEGIRYAAFNVTSVMTTTGFFSTNYMLWGSYPVCLLLILSFIGGCSGSAAGGIKIFRLQLLCRTINAQMKQLIHPHGIFKPQFNDKPVPEGVIHAVLTFFFMYIAVFLLFTSLVSLSGLDLHTSAATVVSALASIGYGAGDANSLNSYKTLPDVTKWLLSAAMVVGRLELFTVLVLFSPSFWRS